MHAAQPLQLINKQMDISLEVGVFDQHGVIGQQ